MKNELINIKIHHIICISNAFYYNKLWTNKQHIMYRLSSHYKILYIDPGISKKFIMNYIKNLKLKYFFKWTYKIKKNFELFSPILLPLTHFNILKPMGWFFVARYINKYIKKYNIKDYILWFYQPEGVRVLRFLKKKPFIVYDCVDDFISQPYYLNRPKVKQNFITMERLLLSKADIVFTTNKNLYNEKKFFNSNVYFIHNVGDYEHFNKVYQKKGIKIPPIMNKIPSPIIGFIGAINSYKIDIELIEYILKNRDYSLVLIGPIGVNDRNFSINNLKKYKNLFLLGEKEYNELPNYIAKFDVCILPYKISTHTKYVFPLKFFEFLATGKPIVATALSSLIKYKDIIELAYTKQDFLKKLDKVIKNDNIKDISKRLKLAARNRWEDRINKLLKHIGDKIETNV